MRNYNYLDAVKEDVKTWIMDNSSQFEEIKDNNKIDGAIDWDGVKDDLNEILWSEDSITGNGSGSYTFNRKQARKYVLDGNGLQYLEDLVDEGWLTYESIGKDVTNYNFESLDVALRCYFLSQAIEEVITD